MQITAEIIEKHGLKPQEFEKIIKLLNRKNTTGKIKAKYVITILKVFFSFLLIRNKK